MLGKEGFYAALQRRVQPIGPVRQRYSTVDTARLGLVRQPFQAHDDQTIFSRHSAEGIMLCQTYKFPTKNVLCCRAVRYERQVQYVWLCRRCCAC